MAIDLHGPELELEMRLKDMEMDLQDFEAHLGFVSDRFKSALDLVSFSMGASVWPYAHSS